MDDDPNSSKEYFHFETNTECDTFVRLLTTSNIHVTHKCCRGKGCGIHKDTLAEANAIYLNFKSQIRN